MSPLHAYLSSLPQHEADALRMIAIAGFLHSIADTGVMSGAAGRAADKAFIQRLVRALALEAFGSAERFDAGTRRMTEVGVLDLEAMRAMTIEFLTTNPASLHYRRPDAAQAGVR